MKKTYERPAVYIERFDLAQSIAAGCSVLETFGGTSVNNLRHHHGRQRLLRGRCRWLHRR